MPFGWGVKKDENGEFEQVGKFKVSRRSGGSSSAYKPDARGCRMGGYSKSEAFESLRDAYPNASEAALLEAIDDVYDNER